MSTRNRFLAVTCKASLVRGKIFLLFLIYVNVQIENLLKIELQKKPDRLLRTIF